MRGLRTSIVVLALAVLVPPQGAQSQPAQPQLPRDVIALLQRRTKCQYWSGVKSANPGQGADFDSIMRPLKCPDIPVDEVVLRRKYAENSGVVAALDATWVLKLESVPIVIAPVTPLPK